MNSHNKLLSSLALITSIVFTATLPGGNANAIAAPAHSTAPIVHSFVRAKAHAVPTGNASALTLQQIKAVYKLPTNPNASTIGISVVGHNPNLLAEVNTSRQKSGLAPLVSCQTATQRACLQVVDAFGGKTYPAFDSSWGLEETLDVYAAGLSPSSRIIVSEANAPTYDGTGSLGNTLDTLVRLGAKVVNMSWGSGEWSSEGDFAAQHLSAPGVRYVAASGDSGTGATFPGTAPKVVSVGGTTAILNSTGSRLSETVWSGTGGGCSAFTTKPADQARTMCGTMKYQNDLSAVADPATGVALYYQGSFSQIGGTSLASPIMAAAYALAGTNNVRPHSTRNMYDVRVGSNGACLVQLVCAASRGLDGPSGYGVLIGVTALQ